jgi:peptide-methionine (R)-S-oxide reductase
MEKMTMNRRKLLGLLASGAGALTLGSAFVGSLAMAEDDLESFPRLDITLDQWEKILGPERFRILFRAGTESPHSSPLDKLYESGTYVCAACNLPLFDSEDKYDSGTGWPSYTQPMPGRIATELDFKMIFPRTEYHCVRCGGHQGHVFKDGPKPTGQRWCNNGLALKFVPEHDALPTLRTSA